MKIPRLLPFLAPLLAMPLFAHDLGIFSNNTDIGSVSRAGTVDYDATWDAYTVSASGENMWFDNDEFHYVWKKVDGDVSLQADIAFVGSQGNAHRKAGVMIRQDLDHDSVYADAVVHGDGLTSFQFRTAKGGVTREIQANVWAPRRLRIEKVGDTAYVYFAQNTGEELQPGGGSTPLELHGSFYVGLLVCAHDNTDFQTAILSNVKLSDQPSGHAVKIRSIIETVPVASGDRRAIYATENLIEAPNWAPNEDHLIYNGGGRLYKLGVAPGSEPELLEYGHLRRANNDHGITPDGKTIIISDGTDEGQSVIYTAPIAGGTPTRITAKYPSYWHGVSPDGRTLAYVGRRDDVWGIFTIPTAGGEETRITSAPNGGLDDGPDYSPDGKYIYINSDRGGNMQIWRMLVDGSELTQITNDDYDNWFPHPSPDGTMLTILSYPKHTEGHPRDKDIVLRIMDLETGEIRALAAFFGGQGTINVPSWNPASTHIAYVRYQPAVD